MNDDHQFPIGGDRERIATFEAQITLLIQQNEELHHRFPTQSQFEVNWNGHSENQGNHSHHSNGQTVVIAIAGLVVEKMSSGRMIEGREVTLSRENA